MKTTADYMDALRAHLHVDSDFKAMNALGVKHRQQVSEWRQLHGSFGQGLSIKVAETLGIPREQVLLDMQIQRETNEEAKAVWKKIAERMAIAAALVGVAVIAPHLTGADPALLLAGFTSGPMYIMSNAPIINLAHYEASDFDSPQPFLPVIMYSDS